jgi:hypothetical protein
LSDSPPCGFLSHDLHGRSGRHPYRIVRINTQIGLHIPCLKGLKPDVGGGMDFGFPALAPGEEAGGAALSCRQDPNANASAISMPKVEINGFFIGFSSVDKSGKRLIFKRCIKGLVLMLEGYRN